MNDLAKQAKQLGAERKYICDGTTGRGMYWVYRHNGMDYRLTQRPGEGIKRSDIETIKQLQSSN